MHDGHLRERVAHHQRDRRADDVGDDHAGAREPDVTVLPRNRPTPIAPPDRDHRELAGAEAPLQAFFSRDLTAWPIGHVRFTLSRKPMGMYIQCEAVNAADCDRSPAPFARRKASQ